jgi:hypothetical protein
MEAREASISFLRTVAERVLVKPVLWRVVRSRNVTNGFRLQFAFCVVPDDPEQMGVVVNADGTKRFFNDIRNVVNPILEVDDTPVIQIRPDLRNEVGSP